MQCEEWADANSELFKEAHDETVHKNSYKRKLYELISASLKLIAAKGGDTTALGSERPVKPENPPAGSRFILRTFSATTLLHNLRCQPRPFLLRHSRPPHNPQRPKDAVKPQNPSRPSGAEPSEPGRKGALYFILIILSAKSWKRGSITFPSIFSGCHCTAQMSSLFLLSTASMTPSLERAAAVREGASFLIPSL